MAQDAKWAQCIEVLSRLSIDSSVDIKETDILLTKPLADKAKKIGWKTPRGPWKAPKYPSYPTPAEESEKASF